jgi:tryptophan 2,3-dioxygenase
MSESESVLPGKGKNDYEKYLKIPQLLDCQKPTEELAHRDELMFQIVHQTAELWMKLQIFELKETRARMEQEDCLGAMTLLRRVTQIQNVMTQQIRILESMNPWEYHNVRRVLGQGSGLESPGFQTLALLGPTLWPAYDNLLKGRGIEIDQAFTEKEQYHDLFLLAEALADYDESFQIWRFHHLKLIEREIGGKVLSLKGSRAIDYLSENIEQRFYPELWEVRNRLTRRSGTSY